MLAIPSPGSNNTPGGGTDGPTTYSRLPFTLLTSSLVLLSLSCMEMKEGTYEYPTPLPSPISAPPQIPQPVVPVAPALAASARATGAGDCDTTGGSGLTAAGATGALASSVATRRINSSGRVSASQGVAAPRPFAPTPLQDDPQLSAAIKARMGEDAGSFGVVVKNLQTGRGASFNADRSYYSASVFKLFVMFEILHQESQGFLRLKDEVLITPYYDGLGVGPRATRLCQRLTIREALEAMMSRSDNAAAVLLQELAGSGNIERSMRALGLKQTNFLTEDLPTSAGDLARLLEGIGRFQAVSRSASEEMIRLMTTEQFDNGLRSGTPPGVQVAHKTGNYNGVTHDAGIVFTPSGPCVIVVLSDGANPTGVTKDIAALVYNHFTAPPAATPGLKPAAR